MEEEPVNVIRESTRNLLKLNRQHQRDEVSDKNRCINDIRITPETISNIAHKLKTKSCITVSNLQTLKNGLMDDPNYGSIVLSTQGALRGLVRELTGHEVKKQCAAAGCLCNLALADCRGCGTIAIAAGPYLVTALDNLTTELAVTCAWALGNLAGSGPKTCQLLISQGALAALCGRLQASEEVRDAAVYALVHFAYVLKDDLRLEHLKRILQEVVHQHLTLAASQLLFILSCHKDFPECNTEELLTKVLEDLPNAMDNHVSACKTGRGNIFCCKLIHLIRILGNMDASKIYGCFMAIVAEKLGDSILNMLSLESPLSNSLLWLLGNLYNFNGDSVFFHTLLQENIS